MDDDFNTPRALSALFECAGQINRMESQSAGKPLTDDVRRAAASLCALMDELAADVLGLDVKKQRHVATGTLTGTGAAVVGTASVSVEVSDTALRIPSEVTPLVKLIEKLGEKPLGDTEELCLSQLVDIRAKARKQRNFALGDQIRSGLAELGFELLDRPGGVTEWKKK